jgi:hypothetical protein
MKSESGMVGMFRAKFAEKRGVTDKMKDWRGNEILIGSHVVKTHHVSSISWIQEYEVLTIEDGVSGTEAHRIRVRPLRSNPWHSGSHRDVWLTKLNTVTVVDA